MTNRSSSAKRSGESRSSDAYAAGVLGELASKIIDFRARAWSTEHMLKVDAARLYRWSLEPETLKFFPLRDLMRSANS